MTTLPAGANPARSPRWLDLWPWLAALASGLLLVGCFPPFNQGWMIWFAVTPLLAAVWFGPEWKRPWLRRLTLGYVAGLGFFWPVFSWLQTVTVAGWVAIGFYLACYLAFWSWFVGLRFVQLGALSGVDRFNGTWRNLGRAALCASAWLAHEYVRSVLFSGFGWNSAGVALHQNLALIQIADFAGVAGVSFVVIFGNVILVTTVARLGADLSRLRAQPAMRDAVPRPGTFKLRPRWDFTLTMALIGLIFVHGVRALQRSPGPTIPLRVAAVQANIPQAQKFDPAFEQLILDRYERLTDLALALDPQLLLWPEAATPRDFFEPGTVEYLRGIIARGRFDFLLGSLEFSTDGDFNIAALLAPAGDEYAIYRKVHLVPFGEYVPLRHSFPLFAMIAGSQVPSDFTPGREHLALPLHTAPVKIAPLICFEDTIGELTRRFVLNGAQLLVNVTNDGWFQRSAGSEQHLANAIFRAIETRRPMVRAANTGITCAIDTRGRVDRWVPKFAEGFAMNRVAVPVNGPLTFYARHGEVFAFAAIAITVVALLAEAVISWRKRS